MESIKSMRRWSLTKFLVGSVVVGLIATVGLVLVGKDVIQFVIAYSAFVTFSGAIIATNLATKPQKEECDG